MEEAVCRSSARVYWALTRVSFVKPILLFDAFSLSSSLPLPLFLPAAPPPPPPPHVFCRKLAKPLEMRKRRRGIK